MKTRAIAIAGCGIAGLASAALLAGAGARVVVYDRLTTPRPIGSGLILQPVGLYVLGVLGVEAQVRARGAPIARLHGKSGGRTVLDVRYDASGAGAPLGLAVHRGALFQALYECAGAAGAAMEPAREVIGANGGRLHFAGGAQSPRFDLVIDALGMRSPLSGRPAKNLAYGALWASLDGAEGFAADALEQRYEAARKMAGVLPIGTLPGESRRQCAFFWSLKHAAYAPWRARPLGAWKDEARALWPETAPLLDQIKSHDDLVFAAYAHRTLRSPLSRDVVHVGDSWHATSPQLGQGANMALLDALALARALGRQGDLAIALSEYARTRLWHIRLYQLASWALTPAYQSDSRALAWARDFVAAPLSRLWPAPPLLAALVCGALGGPLAAMGERALRNGNARKAPAGAF